jgi:hypothetical protein
MTDSQIELTETVVESIIMETIDFLPQDINEFYRNLPGRQPSDHSLRVQKALNNLSEDEAIILIRDIVDSSVFAVLSLMDQGFKDKRIKTSFTKLPSGEQPLFGCAVEAYHQRVSPGGYIA